MANGDMRADDVIYDTALAELIQDKDWRWTTRHDALDVDHAAGNVSQELKDEVLKEMLQTGDSKENV